VTSGVAPSGYVAGTRIATPIVVQVTDYPGLPVPGVQVLFGAEGSVGGWSVSENPVTTNAEGKAQTYWNLGREAGPNSIVISVTTNPSIRTEIKTTTIPGSIAYLFMGPQAATLAQGTTLQLWANAADANFNPVPGAAFSWASSNPTAVSVSTSGLVSATAAGNAIITATTQGASATNIVTVPVPAGPGGPGIPPFTMAISAKQDYGISIVRSDGTVESRISCGRQCSVLAGPNWSRDGRKLALSGRRDMSSVLFVANRDGSDLHEVASAPGFPIAHDKGSSWFWPEFYEDWSTDGRLVYVHTTMAGNTIETIAADGTARATVMATSEPTGAPANPYAATDPRWGLGDSMISAQIRGQIYAMNPDGSGLRQLTSASPGAFDHRWSPDGKTIAFSSYTASGQGFIGILDPVSGASRQIAVPRLRTFCWSPNGSQLSLVSLENEMQNWLSIYTVNVDGTGLRQAVVAIMDMFNLVIGGWSPDGRFLVYTDDRRFSGGPVGTQLYAQSVNEGTNTRLSDAHDVIFFSIAETRGCGRYFTYP
jgi:hypothetical protein